MRGQIEVIQCAQSIQLDKDDWPQNLKSGDIMSMQDFVALYKKIISCNTNVINATVFFNADPQQETGPEIDFIYYGPSMTDIATIFPQSTQGQINVNGPIWILQNNDNDYNLVDQRFFYGTSMEFYFPVIPFAVGIVNDVTYHTWEEWLAAFIAAGGNIS